MTRSLEIDRYFLGIRVKRATGTTSAKMFGLYVGMCEQFAAAGAVEWIAALARSPKRGGISFAQAYRHFKPLPNRILDITRLPSPETVQLLWEVERGADGTTREVGAFARWLAERPYAPTSRAAVAGDIRALRAFGSDRSTVADLPALLVKARKDAAHTGHHRAFNMRRTTCQAFLRDTVGQRHALYFAVQDIAPLKVNRRATSGLPADPAYGPAAVREALRRAAPRKGGEVARAWWLLCTTGMRPAELWQEGPARWEVRQDPTRGVAYVYVFASKTHAARELPVVDAAALALGVPKVSRSYVDDLVRALQNGIKQFAAPDGTPRPWPVPVTPYTGRRTFRHACEESGISDTRAKQYRSEQPRTVDELYRMHEVRPYLAADAAKLKAWFGVSDTATTGLRLVTEA